MRTRLGKTSVMAQWVIARARGGRGGSSMSSVVAVADQVTREAEKLRDALGCPEEDLGLDEGALPVRHVARKIRPIATGLRQRYVRVSPFPWPLVAFALARTSLALNSSSGAASNAIPLVSAMSRRPRE